MEADEIDTKMIELLERLVISTEDIAAILDGVVNGNHRFLVRVNAPGETIRQWTIRPGGGFEIRTRGIVAGIPDDVWSIAIDARADFPVFIELRWRVKI